MRYLHVITDLQYGSCGKGLFAGYLALKIKPDTIITAWSPNAGHTFIDDAGNKMVNCALPNGIVAPSVKRVLIGPGSVINPEQMIDELTRYKSHMRNVELLIHPHAAVVFQSHRDAEAKYAFTIGSTMKGVGEAVCQKIRRKPGYLNIAHRCLVDTELARYVTSIARYDRAIDEAECAIIEGAQGFSLSINQGFYPYTTSRDCTTMQLLSDCAVPLPMEHHMTVYGVCRTFPIRVNNRDHSSGPYYPDQVELRWEDLHIEPELTTVTKLPRRVFTFSIQQIHDACRMNGVNSVFLNFCNYMKWPDSDQIEVDDQVSLLINDIERSTGIRVRWTGWGSKLSDIQEIA